MHASFLINGPRIKANNKIGMVPSLSPAALQCGPTSLLAHCERLADSHHRHCANHCTHHGPRPAQRGWPRADASVQGLIATALFCVLPYNFTQFIFSFLLYFRRQRARCVFAGRHLHDRAHEDEEEWWAGDGVDPLYDRQAGEEKATSHLPRRLANCLTIFGAEIIGRLPRWKMERMHCALRAASKMKMEMNIMITWRCLLELLIDSVRPSLPHLCFFSK